MADEIEKKKATVPALVRTAKGVADHAAAVQEMQYDEKLGAFRDPKTVMLALFAYAKITAALLHESEEQRSKEQAAFAKRLGEFETRLTTIERWKVDAELQGADIAKSFEAMMGGGDTKPIEQIRAIIDNAKDAIAPVTSSPPTDINPAVFPNMAPVTALKNDKPTKVEEKDHEKRKGGAA